VSIKNFPSSIASPFCYAIKLQVSLLLLPLSIYQKKRPGCSEKKEKIKKRRKEKGKRKIKERGQMSQHREILSSPSSFQKFFKDQERCAFL
jgi:hypothetical protein